MRRDVGNKCDGRVYQYGHEYSKRVDGTSQLPLKGQIAATRRVSQGEFISGHLHGPEAIVGFSRSRSCIVEDKNIGGGNSVSGLCKT